MDLSTSIKETSAPPPDPERGVMVDPVTGAWNRRYVDRIISSEIIRSRRYRQPLSAALLVVEAPTNGGPQAPGAQALRHVADVAGAAMRMADCVCTLEAGRFLILMPHTAHGGARIAAERLRAALTAHAFPDGERVAAAIAVAEIMAHESAAEFFARLDALLHGTRSRAGVACDARGASDEGRAGARSPMHLEWHDSYASGNAAIDAGHRELFRLGDELVGASLRDDRAALDAALERCFASISLHFEQEENVLARAGYARLEQHHELHRVLLERAEAIRARV